MNVKHTPIGLLLAGLLSCLPLLAGANTLERVRASDAMTLGYLADFAPFSSKDGDQVSGYAIDLCLKVADKVKAELGLPALQVRFVPVKISEDISAVSSGKIDMLCTPTPATLERRKSVSFSVPIYTAGMSAVVRKDAPEALLKALNGEEVHSGPTWRATVNRGLANQTYATTAGGVSEQWIREQMRLLGVVATLVTVDTTDEGIKLVADGKADAFFNERMLLKNYLARDFPDSNLFIIDRIYEYAPVSMVVERGDEDFRLLVDTVLSDLYRSGAIEAAYDKYLGGVNETTRKLFKLYELP